MNKFTKGPWICHGNKVGPISADDDQSCGMMMPVAYIEEFDWPSEYKDNGVLICAAANAATKLAEMDYDAVKCIEMLPELPDLIDELLSAALNINRRVSVRDFDEIAARADRILSSIKARADK